MRSKYLLLAGFALLAPGIAFVLGQQAPAPARDPGNPPPRATPPQPAAAASPAPAARLYPTKMLSPEEEAKTFHVPPGYHMELVLSEPEIRQPVMCAFDAEGRMYVAEMRTYMLDVNGSNELKPQSLVSRHESTHHDGVFDKHTVYADHLLLPREVLPLDNRVLIGETNTDTLKLYEDTKGTGAADKTEVFYQGQEVDENLEHQESGPIWCMDNWIYSTVNEYRLRWTPKGVLKEPVPADGGQWGIAQDENGKIWISNAGGERSFYRFQVPVAYGCFDAPGQYGADFMAVWPLVPIPDVQGGPMRFRPDAKTLNHFTACCGQEIFSGDRLPADLRGDALLCEPVGRLIRRAKISVKDGITTITNAYDHSEFIRSTDANFRPVNMTTGPDGCLYIVDMYHGIIQESGWTDPGSYLRPVILQYGLDKNIGGGRIWRLVHDGYAPGPQPHMLEDSTAQLVTYLTHPNGWWRNTAQKLIVLRQDKSVVPALQAMARTNPDHVARMHAIWTLEGLGALDAGLVRAAMKDPDPNVRSTAIRASETLYKAGDKSLEADIKAMAKDPDVDVSLQSYMTAKRLQFPDWHSSLVFAINSATSNGFRTLAKQVLIVPKEFGGADYNGPDVDLLHKGQQVFDQVCFACHGYDGKGMPLEGGAPGATLAPPLAGSSTVNGPATGFLSVLLHGLAGPVHGKTYTAQMVSMGANKDDWIAGIASYVRNNFGNAASVVEPGDVAKLRAATQVRMQPWTLADIDNLLPKPLPNRQLWKVTASDHSETARFAIDGDPATRYTTGAPQHPGEWFQIELPAPEVICGVYMDVRHFAAEFPRGYVVQTSSDGKTWGKPIAQGQRSGPEIEIDFPAVKTRFVRITQTELVHQFRWAICEVQLMQPPVSSAAATTAAVSTPPAETSVQ
jgi:mono/diheme cytochrome c family protein/glucose/arabinose dehydrogenase